MVEMEKNPVESQYANIVAFRISQQELVLEFGSFFDGQDNNRSAADHTDFSTRIVMPANMLDIMVQALTDARNARDKARSGAATQTRMELKPEGKMA
jgi:hypothetical protein